MIRFQCPICQKALAASDWGFGRKVSCPECGHVVLIPSPVQLQGNTCLGQPALDLTGVKDKLPVISRKQKNANRRGWLATPLIVSLSVALGLSLFVILLLVFGAPGRRLVK
jgi:DNA-directed RNA polymerase subunit RPC12/RpoP